MGIRSSSHHDLQQFPACIFSMVIFKGGMHVKSSVKPNPTLNSGVHLLKPGLEFGVVGCESHHQRQMGTCRTTGHKHCIRIDFQILGMTSDPLQSTLTVDQMFRHPDFRAETVVDRTTDPTT